MGGVNGDELCVAVEEMEDETSAVLTETPTDKYFHCLFIALQIHHRNSEIDSIPIVGGEYSTAPCGLQYLRSSR